MLFYELVNTINSTEFKMLFNQANSRDDLFWTTEAQLKLRKIPYFVRTQARQKIESIARAAQLEEVTADIVEQARVEFGQ